MYEYPSFLVKLQARDVTWIMKIANFMKHPSFSRGRRRGMHEQRIWGDFIPVSLKKAWQLGSGLADLYWSLLYSSLFKLISSKSLAISSVTKAIERNRKQLQSFVFRDHKQEHKRKEMFHHCYMFVIIYDSSSTSWELRNSVLPMLFQSGNVKDVCTSTFTIQGCFFFYWMAFNSNMSIAPVVYIRELRNSVLPMLFHGWKCERRALISTRTFTIQRCFFSAEWPSIQTFTS